MPATFITKRAAELVKVNQIVAEKRDPFGERYLELMEKPEDRDITIARNAIGYLAERYADETGDSDAAIGHARDLASFAVQKFSTISAVPLPKRGSVHSDGAALVSELCRYQAWLETTALDALEVGDKMGKLNEQTAKRMSTAQVKSMARSGGIKETIGQMTKEKGGSK